ncbi:hypothetical protein GCM10011608_10800 [Micromonospora sonchi]|uniref:Uncharacterized protein n=1 Tax=Micromonospora sonchi TaxID=1763543 RepID=A0A917TLR0_9ACTN|nr:hypothetical protein [Micromonospora sonchi]GGM27839.1 hypothetical protein GCM10011608_10800 [Micromonospora sonchi]
MTDLSQQLFDQHRNNLIAQIDALTPHIERAKERYETLEKEAQAEIDAIAAKIPDAVENPNELQYLTRRGAQLDVDLTQAQRSVELAEAWLTLQRLNEQVCVLELRIASNDHMADSGVWAAGNDPYLALAGLEVKETAAEVVSAMSGVAFAKERLRLTRQLHKEIHAALRKLRRAEASR